jgi:hypothetical protein
VQEWLKAEINRELVDCLVECVVERGSYLET